MSNAPAPEPTDPRRAALIRAVDEILRRMDLHKPTGKIYLQVDTKQGGITAVKIGSEEILRH